jgi:hypothetical protein
MQIPDFDLKTVGHNADVDMHENYRTPLFIKDLQHLLVISLFLNFTILLIEIENNIFKHKP